MRTVGFIFLIVVTISASTAVPHAGHNVDYKIADQQFLHRQKAVFELLTYAYDPTLFQDQVKAAKVFDFDVGNFKDEEAVRHFQKLYKDGLINKFKIFTIFNERLRKQAIAVFNLLYSAKDFDTFYNVASWVRENINRNMFVYAFTAAVRHREDLRGIILPAPYETNPYYFFSSEHINLATRLKIQDGFYSKEYLKSNGVLEMDNTIVLTNHSSDHFVRDNLEHKLSYFRNDLGLNSFYYNFHMDYPFWLGGNAFGLNKDRRGSLFYFVNQQILARYYLERLANGFGEIPTLNIFKKIPTGYYNTLEYSFGERFPNRPNNYVVNKEINSRKLQKLVDYETRIAETLYNRYIQMPEGQSPPQRVTLEGLANYVQGNPDSGYNFTNMVYPLASSLLGGSPITTDDYHLIPSVMEHYETTSRDPVTWQLNKRWIAPLASFQKLLPPYTKEHLQFEDVKVEKVQLDKLTTYWDNVDIDINNAIHYTKEEQFNSKPKHFYKVRQERLIHQHFSINYEISSESNHKSVIRLFMGPKYNIHNDVISLVDNYENFVEIDKFVHELKTGKNLIVRDCPEFSNFALDKTPTRYIYKHVLASISGKEQFKLDRSESQSLFPLSLLLPKGTKGGFPVTFFVIVSEWVEPLKPYGETFDALISSGVGSGSRYIDGRELGYPFDRMVTPENFHLPNMFWVDSVIYHKDNSDMNTSTNL